MKAEWEREKEQAQGAGALRDQLLEAKTELERAVHALTMGLCAATRHRPIGESA